MDEHDLTIFDLKEGEEYDGEGYECLKFKVVNKKLMCVDPTNIKDVWAKTLGNYVDCIFKKTVQKEKDIFFRHFYRSTNKKRVCSGWIDMEWDMYNSSSDRELIRTDIKEL